MSSFLSFFHSLIKNGTIPLKSYSVTIEYAISNDKKVSHGHKVRVDSLSAYDKLFDAVNDENIEDNDYVRFSGLNILFIIKRVSGKWILDSYKTWPNYFE